MWQTGWLCFVREANSLYLEALAYVADRRLNTIPSGSRCQPSEVEERENGRSLPSKHITHKLHITFAHTHWPELDHVATPRRKCNLYTE